MAQETQGLCINLERWDGEGDEREGIYVYLRLIYVEVLQKTGEGNGNPLQYSCLNNPMDIGAWWFIGHVVSKSHT